jgi:hypothetical protein
MKKNNIHIISSTLKVVASEQMVTTAELNQEDKPLEEILNVETQKDTEQSKRE